MDTRWRWLAAAVAAFGLAACAEDAADDAAGSGGGGDDGCVDDEAYFEETVWAEVVAPVCMGCHTSDGVARDTDLVLVSEAIPGFVETNMAVMADLAALERDGRSVLLLKPSGGVAHEGGIVAPDGSRALDVLEEFVRRVETPVKCDSVAAPRAAGLTLLTPAETLRRASLLLVGDLPSADQFASVRAGGEPALERAIDELLDDPRFVDRSVEWFNDLLLTDRYLGGQDAIGFTDYDRFPLLYWFESMESGDRYRQIVNDSIAREPLELIAYVIRERRPFTEVLTADYTMVNDFTAASYGLGGDVAPSLDDPAARAFRPERIDGLPHAGVLTMPAFLNRYPTTETNRNRHRVWTYFRLFLATDILTLADRPIDSSESSVHNPTMNDAQCTVCHAVMDPVAGAFQNWTTDGHYAPPEEGWYPDMVEPGFGDFRLQATDRPEALRWLAFMTVSDPRFRTAVVHNAYRVLIGREPLTAGSEAGTPEAQARRAAWARQRDAFDTIGDDFAAADYDFRVVVRELVMSEWFRADGALDEAEAGAVLDAGRFRLLTPEELDRQITAVTGYPWAGDASSAGRLIEDYNLLYGGIDSDAIVERLEDPNGVMIAINERMSVEIACEHLPRDLSLDRDDRLLLPYVDAGVVPETEQGFAIPEAQAAIRQNVQYLMLRLWGEDHALDSVDVQAGYDLFVETWREGVAAVASEELPTALPGRCQSRENFWNGADLPEERRIVDDEDYTVRAWMAVLAWLQRDVRFLYL